MNKHTLNALFIADNTINLDGAMDFIIDRWESIKHSYTLPSPTTEEVSNFFTNQYPYDILGSSVLDGVPIYELLDQVLVVGGWDDIADYARRENLQELLEQFTVAELEAALERKS